MPFVLSSRGYGFLWHNPAIGEVSFGKNRTTWRAESTKQLDYWITAGNTPAQISLAWMLCKHRWIVPIPGTRKEQRMKENAGAADVQLTPDEVRALDDALDHMEMSAVFGGIAVK